MHYLLDTKDSKQKRSIKTATIVELLLLTAALSYFHYTINNKKQDGRYIEINRSGAVHICEYGQNNQNYFLQLPTRYLH